MSRSRTRSFGSQAQHEWHTHQHRCECDRRDREPDASEFFRDLQERKHLIQFQRPLDTAWTRGSGNAKTRGCRSLSPAIRICPIIVTDTSWSAAADAATTATSSPKRWRESLDGTRRCVCLRGNSAARNAVRSTSRSVSVTTTNPAAGRRIRPELRKLNPTQAGRRHRLQRILNAAGEGRGVRRPIESRGLGCDAARVVVTGSSPDGFAAGCPNECAAI